MRIFKRKNRNATTNNEQSKIIKDFHKEKYYNVGKIFCSLLDKEIKIIVDFDVSLEYAEKCVEHLERLKDNTIDVFCEGAINYCERYREFFEECEIDIPLDIKGREILKYIVPQIMIIEKPKGDIPAFHMKCSCKWEEEHGLEWTVLDDEVLYVGGFSDESPWRDIEYFKTASWNYVKIK